MPRARIQSALLVDPRPHFRGTPGTGPASPTNFSGETGKIDACPTALEDLNGDDDVDGFDLALLVGQWTGAASCSPCPPAVATDLNGDCKINGFDLAILLRNWG